MKITVGSTVVAGGSHLSSNVGGETVILDRKGGQYFGLDPVGSRVWSLLATPRRVSAIRDILLSEFEADSESCEADLLELLEDLAAHGLIMVLPDPPSPV